jgi:hypothetical protein
MNCGGVDAHTFGWASTRQIGVYGDGTCGVREDVFSVNGLSDPPIA